MKLTTTTKNNVFTNTHIINKPSFTCTETRRAEMLSKLNGGGRKMFVFCLVTVLIDI